MILPAVTDVFVAGGGPAGLAAAIAARRRGFDVILSDPAVPPIDKACGEGIMPDGLEAARALGIDLQSIPGFAFSGIRFCHRDSAVESRFPNGRAWGVRRASLHQHMVEVAAGAGVRMIWGAAVQGIDGNKVAVAGREIAAGWIVGADGSHSRVRSWAGLIGCRRETRRFGFRAHFGVAPWTDFMELHWGERCQLYITPVAANEICVAVLSRDPQCRLREALPQFPAVANRLAGCEWRRPADERGAVTFSRRLRSVCRGRVALVGDASGSVDAITGEGLCLAFQQSLALADSLAAGDLSLYAAAHARIGRRPEFMAELMLLLERHSLVRQAALAAMAAYPRLFASLLAAHVGEATPFGAVASGLAAGWRVLTS